MGALRVAAALLVVSSVAGAAQVAFHAGDCPPTLVDAGTVLQLLQLEVATTAGDDGEPLDVRLRCDAGSQSVRVHIARTMPAFQHERVVPLLDVAPAARPRTIAIAVAEGLRRAEAPVAPPPAEPPPPPTVAPAATPPPEVTKPRRLRDGRRMELAGKLAIGTAVGGAVTVAVGSALAAMRDETGRPNPGMQAPAAALLALGAASLVTAGACFGVWLVERLRPSAAAVAVMPQADGASLTITGRF